MDNFDDKHPTQPEFELSTSWVTALGPTLREKSIPLSEIENRSRTLKVDL